MTSMARAAVFTAILDCGPTQGVSETSQFLFKTHAVMLKDYSSHAVTRVSAYERFAELAATWKQDTVFTSSFHDIVMNRAYQEIIGLGSKALPWIFAEMRSDPDYWFWALSSLTGIDPVPASSAGDFQAMTESWLDWGEKRGYII